MYCVNCGTKLIEKTDGIDGPVPYCPKCEKFQYPTFNSAISAIIFNPDKTKILLIEQYGRKDNILVAGYVTKGENCKQTLTREIGEEVGLSIDSYYYNDNEYFGPTNTLIHNYIVIAKDENIHIAPEEVDLARWYTRDEAVKVIKPNSLAQHLLNLALMKIDTL